jgi:hypothetical protein
MQCHKVLLVAVLKALASTCDSLILMVRALAKQLSTVTAVVTNTSRP